MNTSPDTAVDVAGPDGQIITFFSYKGGTGRTMALANVAWILASRGKRVLVVDFDLDSPSLHRYFRPFLDDDYAQTTNGVIELLRGCANAMMNPPESGDTEWYRQYTMVEDYVTRLAWGFGDTGHVDLICAGRQTASYPQAVRSFEWPNFYRRLGGSIFLRSLAEDMRANYDYVLIDSQAGINEVSSLCTLVLPDTVVGCFRLNAQSVEGCVAVADSVAQQRPERPIRVLPVPMCVDRGDPLRLQAVRDFARSRFAGYPRGLSGDDADRYWSEVEVPYRVDYAYEETLAVLGEPAVEPYKEDPVLRSFERLAAVLTDGAVHRLALLNTLDRREALAKFDLGASVAPSDVLICYSAVDRMWAEWIDEVLALVDVRAVYREIGDQPGEQRLAELRDLIDQSGRMVLLLSNDTIRSHNGIELWKLGAAKERGGRKRFVVPVRTGQVDLVGPFDDREPIETIGRSAAEVRSALLDALDITGQPSVATLTTRPFAPRFPGERVSIWNVPERSKAFVGRSALLEGLRDQLSTELTVIMPQALYGLGGVGKTQIAHEYARRFGPDYDVVWWIPAEQPTDIPAYFQQLAQEMLIPVAENLQDTVAGVLRALAAGTPYRRWLLIFDNADEPGTVTPFIPRGTGHVLVTSRNPAWRNVGTSVTVGVFTREESVALLQRTVQRLSREDAERVAAKLGDLPLGVEQAAAWLATETNMDIDEYLHLLNKQPQSVLDRNRAEGYPATASAIWTLSLNRVRQRDRAAAKLIELCSFFGPDRIPLSLIYSDTCVHILAAYDQDIADNLDPTLIAPKVQELAKYALLQEDATDGEGRGTVYVHRLVQAVIRDHLQQQRPGAWDENRAQVHQILARFERGDPDDSKTWRGYAEISPHLRPSKVQLSEAVEVRRLIIDVCRYYYKRGDYTSCLELADLALESWIEHSGETHSLVLLLRFHRANALRSQGEYQQAYMENQIVFGRLTETLGPNHAYTLMAANSLGADHRTFGRYEQAYQLAQQTVEVYKDKFGPDDRGTLMAVNNLAVSLRLVGRFSEAERLDKDTWERRIRVMKNHPYTLFSASNYGRDLRETGQFRKSRGVLDKALLEYRESVGATHPDTLRTAKNLAVTMRKQGELAAAHELTTWALMSYRRIVSEDHLDYLACLLNLACDESALERDRVAQGHAEDVLERYTRLLGPDHTFTLGCRNNLGIFVRRQYDHVSARAMSEAVMAGFRQTLGADHPYTFAAELNHANDLFALGEIERALILDNATYNNFTRSLGQLHPDTLASAVNLSISKAAAGEVNSAATLLSATLARMVDVLGKDHPNVLQATPDESSPAQRPRFNCDIEPPPT